MTGALTLVMFAVSGLLAIVQADPKLYLLRESTMTLAMGIMLLGTLLPLQVQEHQLRPFMFYVARQVAMSSSMMDDQDIIRANWDLFWQAWPSFRTYFRALTATWGAGLVSEFVLRVILLDIFDDVDTVLYYSNIYMFAFLGIMGSLTVASTLLFRHLYNREQARAIAKEQQDELDRIIEAAALERQQELDQNRTGPK
ncbi:hypothetical protein DM01DRAFT_1333718 [Hesseltinella vesiculosa]|uniref:Uncharacterized protein n=1 Tax=Hesseltinella vesiculosa TaxID=101127 RepID=A0A1X2GNQ4_9FUNG|nr:hypothetical protein DM01DRAFT_1333718 [Hesseltinella vesiculosa]